MNRELKFRALYKGKLYQVNFLDLKNRSVDINVNGVATTTSIKDTTIQQYTGLKDKNGKEIYEGDIVKTVKKDEWMKLENYPVKYEKNGCHNLGWFSSVDRLKTEEVIGNIHENPELLN